MEKTERIWLNGELVPWDEAKIHVLTNSMHYGTGVFEGIRMYETCKGPAVFRLNEHIDRLYYSAKCMRMNLPWSKEEFTEALMETIRVNKIKECYIRPIFYYGYKKLGLNPLECPVEGAIAAFPWGSYLGNEPVKVKISDIIRIHPKSSVTDAKICGHYVNSFFAVMQAKENGYTEALLLDYEGNIAEGPGENFFMVKDGKILTPSLGKILAGITRDSIFEIAGSLGYEIIERPITPEDSYLADECFFTGTAAEITPIQSIDDHPMKNEFGPITRKIKEEFTDIINGKNEKYFKWLTFI